MAKPARPERRTRPGPFKVVARKAVKDESFLKALLEDPDAALADARIHLARAELRLLRTALKGREVRLKVDPEELVDWARRIRRAEFDPWDPPIWIMGKVPGIRVMRTLPALKKKR